ncbi:MAG: two-component sensor histidine kinase [Deltaproteobacteria bacterium]|nr:two-component sensor histidine kinase [Deltaproteobacteria bacterium]
MIAVPFIPFILILSTGYYYFANSLETSTTSSMKRIVDDHRQMIESFLNERKADLEFVQQAYAFEELGRSHTLIKVFRLLQTQSNAFVDLGIFDELGIHIAYHGPYELKGKIYSHTEWFQNVMKHGYYISDIFLGYRKVPHFIIALAREENDRKWVIRATIDTLMFNELVKKIRIGSTGEAYILNKTGHLQTERRSGGNLMELDKEYLPHLTYHEGAKTFIAKSSGNGQCLYVTTWLKDRQWQLVVRQEKSDAFQSLRAATYLIVIISVIGGILILAVAFFLTNRIVRRMQQLDAEKDLLGEQLIRASRLAELGEMAAGFAHEINNPLQIIKYEQTLIEMLMAEIKQKGDLRESETLSEIEDSFQQINLQISRCAEITGAILKFGHKTETKHQNVDLNNFIPEVIAMVSNKAKVNGIALTQQIQDEPLYVHVDPAQLQQVFINLFNNAIDAVIERHGGHGGNISVEILLSDNGIIRIQVRDNGCGISPENLKKIFSPFFTTKPVGKGTGLGLSVCYGIINNMGGSMHVSSEQGHGTTFTVNIPSRQL